jgi:hypothetical protein
VVGFSLVCALLTRLARCDTVCRAMAAQTPPIPPTAISTRPSSVVLLVKNGTGRSERDPPASAGAPDKLDEDANTVDRDNPRFALRIPVDRLASTVR